MAQVTTPVEFKEQLATILVEGLQNAGFDARIEVEPLPPTNLHRVYVVSEQRDQLEPSEWSELLWRIIKRRFGDEADLRISTIYTGTPEQLESYRSQEE